MPPTNVEMTKPTVTVMIPALARRVVSETSKKPRIMKVIIRIAIPMERNWRIVATWIPIRGVKSVFIRRKKIRAVNVKMKTKDIPINLSKNMGRFVCPATKSSKNKMVIAAKTTIKSMKAASFFMDENIPAKVILPVP
jgi:hypothetical protein